MGQLEDFRASLKKRDSAMSSEEDAKCVLRGVSGGEGGRRKVL